MFRKINAPTLAYITVYGHEPSPPISGREATHETYNLNGVAIDKAIPKRVMSSLMKMKDIETRASCQGQSPRLVTFLIFRPLYQQENYVVELYKNLKAEGLKVYYDVGMQGKYRICVAEKLWYSKETEKAFKEWWNTLPHKISNALLKTNEKFKIGIYGLTLYATVYRQDMRFLKKYGLLSLRAMVDLNNTYLNERVKEFIKKTTPSLVNKPFSTVIDILEKIKDKVGFGPDSIMFFLRNVKVLNDPSLKKQVKDIVVIPVDYKVLVKYKPRLVYDGKVKEVTWTELKEIASSEKYDKLFEGIDIKKLAAVDVPIVLVDAKVIPPKDLKLK